MDRYSKLDYVKRVDYTRRDGVILIPLIVLGWYQKFYLRVSVAIICFMLILITSEVTTVIFCNACGVWAPFNAASMWLQLGKLFS